MIKPFKIKPCPKCGRSGKRVLVNRIWVSGSMFDKHLYFIECSGCHWCGPTKLFKWRAILHWNRRKK